jgi:hypothetical protein
MRLIRPEDMVILDIRWVGMSVVNQSLVVDAGRTSGFLIVEFPAQHCLEQAFFLSRRTRSMVAEDEPTDVNNLPEPPVSEEVWSRLSGPSRLVFLVPAGTPVPLAASEFLEALSGFRLSIAPNAWAGPDSQKPRKLIPKTFSRGRRVFVPAGSSSAPDRIVEPPAPVPIVVSPAPPNADRHTAIELPYRLLLSPNEHSAWFHRTQPFHGEANRTELWHTRLGVWLQPWVDPAEARVDGEHRFKTVRAIWALDEAMDIPGPGDAPWQRVDSPFRASLNSFDRRNIVHLSSNFGLTTGSRPYLPAPINVNQLMLSSLGGWLDSRGVWDNLPAGLSVEEWRHRAVMARDHYVRIVYQGRLFCLGHAAALIKVTERIFHGRAGLAYLRQRYCIVVREPVRTYRDEQPAALLNAFPEMRRNFPFQAIRITTLVSPDIDDPGKPDPNSGFGSLNAFWPHVAGAPFRFHCEAVDADGQIVDFSIPLMFVDKVVTEHAQDIAGIEKQYASAPSDWRVADLNGQSVAYAVRDDASPDASQVSYPTESVTLAGFVPDAATHDSMDEQDARFFPVLERAVLVVPALQALAGNGTLGVRYWSGFLSQEWNGNENSGEVFLEAAETGIALVTFSDKADRSGALATPDLAVIGLSRRIGPLSGSQSAPDLTPLAKNKFDPTQYFESVANAKLLGSLALSEIVALGTLEDAPRFTSIGRKRRLEWTAALQSDSNGCFIPKEPPLQLTVEVIEPEVGDTASEHIMKVSAKLQDFTLELAKVVSLEFKTLSYSVVQGKKPDIDVEFADHVQFLGALRFVDTLRTAIPEDGFSDPPAVEVSAAGITAGYGLNVPSVAVGAFSLQGLRLSAGFNVPFGAYPMHTWFDFATRENPALLTVGPFGGAAFVGVRIHPQGLQGLEASLEFGAGVAMNFGVAAGSVTAMGGVYIEYREDGIDLIGFFRVRGTVKALGVISVSIELYVGLEPWADIENPKALEGHAHIWIEVDLGLVEKDIKISASKKFAGALDPMDPSFGEMVAVDEWDQYWRAFAH